MKRLMQNFLLMIQLLTRIPVNLELPCEEDDFKGGSLFFSTVGLVIGAIQLLIFLIAKRFLSIELAIIFVILIDIFITGGFHIDGFGDTADGFFAFKGKDKIIDIMKDSRIGTFAGIAIVMNLLIKFIGYGSALENTKNVLVILLVPMISRASVALISYIGKPAKDKGTGNLFINTVGMKEVIFNYIIFFPIAIFTTNIYITIVLILTSLLITIIFNKYCESKINGITGDILGATNELITLIILIILSVKLY